MIYAGSVPFEIAYIAASLLVATPFKYAEADIAYVAGLFDGEGHIGINRVERSGRATQYTLRCQVSSTDRELLIPFETFGGIVSKVDASRWNENAKTAWKWNVHCQEASTFLRSVGPFLRCDRKRECARIAIAMEMSRLPKGGMCRWSKEPEIHDAREVAWLSIKELNGSGILNGMPAMKKDTYQEFIEVLERILRLSDLMGFDIMNVVRERLGEVS